MGAFGLGCGLPVFTFGPHQSQSRHSISEISHLFELTRPAVVVCADGIITDQPEASLFKGAWARIPLKILTTQQVDSALPTWTPLGQIMSGELAPPDTPDPLDAKDICMTIFTSGTTSLPKPCEMTSLTCVSAGLGYKEARQLNSGHKLVQHLRNSHSYGIAWSLTFWLAGAAVALPSAAFEAQASLECFDLFKTTHMSLVPTTAQANLAHPYFKTADISSLVSVDMSEAGVLPRVIETCGHGRKVP